ncbi:hypothetical protein Q4Q54_13155 [Shewanella sp. SP2S2-4]|uniref:hypothetical protein n=1 Tax=Shewanella sp. SP2S2-4 TaxID=3063539 RepID=UPI0028903F91|nr:hypothetical protein [Shewanella sp. SP2S2-4]MDT3274432.1 hypothetical protein [Shewanella sp. SP2S2-4]
MTVLNTRISLVALACAFVSPSLLAEDSSLINPAISAVLNGYYQTGERPLAESPDGFGLGETELALSANIDDMFYGKVTAVVEMHDGDTELNLEEAFIQTMAMPAGFSIRGGRFLSDIGYLNNQHLHTDSFTDRPVVYRAFLGGHYFDDGIRFNYVAPTDLYWTMGVEAFKGDSLRAADEHGEREFKKVGVYTLYSKIGGDIGDNSSWQAGLSYLRNENGQVTAHEEGEHEDEHAHGDEHEGHSHAASYTGKNTYGADFVYKWAPNGNYKYQNLTVSGEYYRVSDFTPIDLHPEDAPSQDYHQGWYLSSVYQFTPSWSAGVRYGEADTQELHGDHFHGQKLKESEVSLAWHSSHFSSVRFQYTNQKGTNFDGIEDDNIFTIQYIMSLGAHGAHQF